MNNKIRIGFDLDGVIIGKPFFVPKCLIDKLVRNKAGNDLEYRYPASLVERNVRILSHHPLFRPPIKENIKLIEKLHKDGRYELFAVSARYSFLKKRTDEWFGFYNLGTIFNNIYINQNDEQPHIFKRKMIEKLKLKMFVDDDRPLLKYLKKHVRNISLIYVSEVHKYFLKK